MDTVILSALDDLSSSRSSLPRRASALASLERVLWEICIASNSESAFQEFKRLQDSFETNLASRVLAYLGTSLPLLQSSNPSPSLAGSSTPNQSRLHSPVLDSACLHGSIIQSLNILQGLAFLHAPSKVYLGRKANLQLLLDILLLSRPHHGVPNLNSSFTSQPSQVSDKERTPSVGYPSPIPLSPLESVGSGNRAVPSTSSNIPLALLDTLLCVLVDLPPALRAFEDANGLEAIVRTLKRAGVPREVRMKCLEFLYFYLLPETPPKKVSTSTCILSTPASRNTTPPSRTPYRPKTPTKTTDRASSKSSRAEIDVEIPPVPCLSDSQSTASSDGSDAGKASVGSRGRRAREELERFVPVTPKKVKQAKIGSGTPRRPRGDIPSLSLTTPSRGENDSMQGLGIGLPVEEREAPVSIAGPTSGEGIVRTTEEKKERLGAWLGNVNQLVEGVRNAGIWGVAYT